MHAGRLANWIAPTMDPERRPPHAGRALIAFAAALLLLLVAALPGPGSGEAMAPARMTVAGAAQDRAAPWRHRHLSHANVLVVAAMIGSGGPQDLTAPSLQEMAAQAYVATLVGMGLILASTWPR